ncbi:MAG: ABC transporter permease [Micrococcales bacterium]|nr:ABC transporter permease [Micrococcales bacterium]
MSPSWWLVAKREISSQLAGKAFKISTVLLVIAVFGGTLAAGLVANSADDGDASVGGDQASGTRAKVAVVGQLPAAALAVLEPVEVANAEAAAKKVEDGEVEAGVVMGDDLPVVLAKTEVPDKVMAALTVVPAVKILEPARVSPTVALIATMVSVILFYFVVMIFGQVTAQNTVVEKQTRVVEILLTSVPAKTLLAGKVVGNAIMAMCQIVLMLAAGVLGLVVTGKTSVLPTVSSSLIWFVVLFVLGFLLFSSLLAGCAALVSRVEDVAAATMPVIMLMIIPYILAMVRPNDESFQTVLSMVPFSAPMTMPARVLTTDVPPWQLATSLALLALTAWGAVWLGGKLYETSLLRMGTRVKFSQAFRTND